VAADAEFKQMGPLHMDVGDVLIIGTDGIWEARNQQGEFYGQARFLDVLKANHQLDAEALADCLMNHVTDFIGPASRIDDITMVLVKAR
jgi:sigma-B regulation protein RsbU (phosphoserine phosphatase)